MRAAVQGSRRAADEAGVPAPCVLAVGNALVSMLRAPTLKDRLATREEPVAVLSAAELGVDTHGARVVTSNDKVIAA